MDKERKIAIMRKFVKDIGEEKIARYIVAQDEVIDGLRENMQSWIDYKLPKDD